MASHTGDVDINRAPGLISGFQGFMNVHRGTLTLVCPSDIATVLWYSTIDGSNPVIVRHEVVCREVKLRQ